jgi:hypothetical protein
MLLKLKAVFRIHMFLGLPEPDPSVRVMDPDPHFFGPAGSISQRQCSESGSTGSTFFGPPRSGSIIQRQCSGSGILLSSSKNSQKNLDSFCFLTSFGLFIFEK